MMEQLNVYLCNRLAGILQREPNGALTFRYLLNGELSEARKAAFRTEAHACVASIFAGIGGGQNG